MSIYNKNICSNNGFARDFSKGKSFDFSEWNPVKTYVNDSFKQDFVTYNGDMYVCIHTNTNVIPGTSDCWMHAVSRLSSTTFVPNVDDNGNLSWNIYTGSEVPETVNIKGEPGDRGIEGKSAYEIWLDKGNIGSENDFFESYRGYPGIAGEKGEKGDNAPMPEFYIDSKGHLIIVIDGTESDLGKVVGEGEILPDMINLNWKDIGF